MEHLATAEVAKTVGVAASARTSRTRRTPQLPDDVFDQSIRRLGNIAAVIGVLFLVSLPAHFILQSEHVRALSAITIAIRITFVCLSGLMFVIARSRRVSRRVKANVGLAYEVVGAAATIMIEMWLLAEWSLPVGTVSFVVVWICLVRLLVPTTRSRALIAAGLSIATVPLCVWVIEAAGLPAVDKLVLATLVKTTSMAAVFAVFASRGLYRLGTAVGEARELGSYRLEERLGAGGMGEVWRASHRLLQRSAAIKLIRPEALGPGNGSSNVVTQKRFKREARATAQLGSVHSVQLFDYGRTESGEFYYVMELLDGVDLETLVERFGPVPAARAAHILRQICHSLTDAHDRGFIHRDVKPSNIFVCRLGPDYDFVKVLDFGLVKDVSTDADANPGLTNDGFITGTPAYLAPEVALGFPEAGEHTDIYMLGCVAYWLLTGELVFEGRSPMAIVTKHIDAKPVPVSQRSELDVPQELEQIVMDCLEKEPSDRPQDAKEVMNRLDEIGFDRPWTNATGAQWWQLHQPTEQTTESTPDSE